MPRNTVITAMDTTQPANINFAFNVNWLSVVVGAAVPGMVGLAGVTLPRGTIMGLLSGLAMGLTSGSAPGLDSGSGLFASGLFVS